MRGKKSGLRDAPSSSVCLCVRVSVCVCLFLWVSFLFPPIGSVLLAAQKYTFQTVVIETNIVELFVAIHNDLPMLIRSEGVGLRLQNRRERGENKKQRTKMHFVSDYVV